MGNQKRCSEIASDSEIENAFSAGFHHAAGFNEVNRIICFAKKVNYFSPKNN